MPEYDVVREGRTAKILPGRELVASTVAALKPKLGEVVREGVERVVFDLTNTAIVDSVGIGLFVAAHNSIRKWGGTVSVIHASGDLLDLFRALRLDQHFIVAGTNGDGNPL